MPGKHHGLDVPVYFFGEGNHIHFQLLVDGNSGNVLERRQPQALELRPRTLLDHYLLKVLRYRVPNVFVDDVVSIAESDHRPGHIVGDLEQSR